MHTTRFRQIFTPPLPPKNGAKKSKNKSKVKDPKKLKVKDPELQRLSNEAHLADWILVVSSLLQWHQWMKQSTISKAQVTKSHCAVQWLMRQMASVSPRASGMGNNTIKTHLVLHLSEDILDHGVPENVNSAYAESAHIPLSKITARNTQKRAKTFTRQAAHRYIENLAIASAWQDMQQDIIHKGGSSLRLLLESPVKTMHFQQCLADNSQSHGGWGSSLASAGIGRIPQTILVATPCLAVQCISLGNIVCCPF
ncbi:hypothetical protein MHU86_13762 [Fragilaria crotonensis]|nr:hypothetical protein MHU86_13762 [Fragilaria crotonensis]